MQTSNTATLTVNEVPDLTLEPVDETICEEQFTELVERRNNGRVIERNVVVEPVGVGLATGLTNKDVLEPVGAGPSGGAATLKAEAPRCKTVIDDLL